MPTGDKLLNEVRAYKAVGPRDKKFHRFSTSSLVKLPQSLLNRLQRQSPQSNPGSKRALVPFDSNWPGTAQPHERGGQSLELESDEFSATQRLGLFAREKSAPPAESVAAQTA